MRKLLEAIFKSRQPLPRYVDLKELRNGKRRLFNSRVEAEYHIGTLLTSNPEVYEYLRNSGQHNTALCWVDDQGIHVLFIETEGQRFFDIISVATGLKDLGIYAFRWIGPNNSLSHQTLFSKGNRPTTGSYKPYKLLAEFCVPMLSLEGMPYTEIEIVKPKEVTS